MNRKEIPLKETIGDGLFVGVISSFLTPPTGWPLANNTQIKPSLVCGLRETQKCVE